MAALEIKKFANGTFAHTLDGDYANSIIDNEPNTTSFGDKFNFKTRNGANIIKRQFITFDEITYINVANVSFTFANVQAVWSKLIDEEYFLGLNQSSGGSGSDRFDELLDTFTYIGNDGKVPVVDQAQLKLVPTTFYNFNEFKQLEDVEINLFVANKLIGVNNTGDKIVLIDPPADPVQLANTIGYFNISDLTTQSTPLNYASGDLVLTNDDLGVDSDNLQRPYGVSVIWNSVTSRFDFSQLSVGDEIILSSNIKNTTTATNQIVKIRLVIGEGTADEKIYDIAHRNYKTIVTDEKLGGVCQFFIKSNLVKNAPAKIIYSSDNLSTIKVTDFMTTIIRKGVNVIDVDLISSEAISTDDNNALVLGTDGQLFVPTADIPSNLRSTSFISGSGVTINGVDNTKIDIDIVGKIVNPSSFSVTPITVSLTSQPVTYRTTQVESYLWVNSSGVVVQSLTPPLATDYDSIIGFWVMVHSNLSTLNVINPFPFYEDGVAVQLEQILNFIGFSKYPGTNQISIGTTGSRLTHSGGLVIKSGGGNTSKRPVFSLNGVIDDTFRMRTMVDTEGANTQTFDTTNFNPTGSTVSAMTNNRFTASAIWKFSSSLIRCQYGKTEFSNLSEALQLYDKSSYTYSPNGLRNGVLIGWIIFKKGITLSTAVDGTDYKIIDVTTRGVSGVGAPVDITADHYKGTYNASTNTPSLSNGAGQIGDNYKVSVAGSRNFGAGSISFSVGDIVSYDGTIYYKSVNNSQIGSVTPTTKTTTSSSLATQDVTGFLTYVNAVTSFSIAANEIVKYLITDTGQIFEIRVNNRSVGSGQTALTGSDVLMIENENNFLQSKWKTFDFDNSAFFLSNTALNGGTFIVQSDSLAPASLAREQNKYTTETCVIQSAASTNSGGHTSTLSQEQAYEGYTMFFIMRPLEITDTTTRFGLVSSGQANPGSTFTQGIMIEIINNTLTMKTGSPSTGLTSSTSGLTVNATDWLYVLIELEQNNAITTRVRCRIKNSFNGADIFNQPITANIPASTEFNSVAWYGLRMGVGSRRSSATLAYLSQWGYMGYGVKKPNFLKTF